MEPGPSERAEDPDATAEPVAAGGDAEPRSRRFRRLAVRVDSDESLLTAARRLRRRLLGDEQFGDPLSTAGDWQMAVMFTDLVGFSSWALQAGDEPALALLREVGARVEAVIARHDGRIVKRLGDGVMATFLSARAAVDAALDAQDEMAEIEIGEYRPRMRAGVHWGSPRPLGGDYLGVDVNIAARVSDAAKSGQVLVSGPLLAQMDDGDLHTGRPRRLKADGAPRDLYIVAISRP